MNWDSCRPTQWKIVLFLFFCNVGFTAGLSWCMWLKEMYVLPKFLGAENRLYIYICRNAATCLAVNEGIFGSGSTLLFLFLWCKFLCANVWSWFSVRSSPCSMVWIKTTSSTLKGTLWDLTVSHSFYWTVYVTEAWHLWQTIVARWTSALFLFQWNLHDAGVQVECFFFPCYH